MLLTSIVLKDNSPRSLCNKWIGQGFRSNMHLEVTKQTLEATLEISTSQYFTLLTSSLRRETYVIVQSSHN